MTSEISPLPAQGNDKKDKPFSVLVALDRDYQPSVRDVAKKLKELFPKLKPVQDLVEDETGFGFTLHESIVVFIRMSGPVPLDPDADQPTVKRPLSAVVLESQRAYIVIAVRELDSIQAAIAATQAAAALIECCPHAIAVYWPAARQWLAPRMFVDQAVKHVHSSPPIDLWIDVRVWQVEGKKAYAGRTRGLRALGHKEFEVRSSPESAKDLRERLEGLCWYVLTNGAIVEDGHTVGHDCAERISVLLCRSVHGGHDLVLRLDYDEDFEPRRPWWKLI